MRLLEVDTGSAQVVLKILRGLANEHGQSGRIPYAAFLNKMKQFDLPLGGPNSDRQQMITALKNANPQLGAIIKSVEADGTIVLDKTNEPQDQSAGQAGGPSVDAMAASNSKTLSPKI